ncbi:hypothetical protein FACS1894199_03770 [Bacteroidia bacterium]|nr:hypothetical protein FACS1894199_03770 [Bacteroidia bacterium]
MKTTISTQATFESIREILDRTAKRQEAFEKLQEKRAAEADKRRKEYEKQCKKEAAEADKRREKEVAEADKRREKEAAEYEEQRKKEAAEADKRRKEYEKQCKKEAAESRERMKKIEETVGGISNNNGYFAEEYFINALQKKKTFAGIRYDYVDPNMKYRLGNVQDEFDIVMFNSSSIAIIEIEYSVQLDFLTTLTTQKVQNFRTLFPYYAKHKIYLGIASMSFNKKVIMGAKKLGIGMLKPQGDTLECDTEHIKAY